MKKIVKTMYFYGVWSDGQLVSLFFTLRDDGVWLSGDMEGDGVNMPTGDKTSGKKG